MPFLTEQMQFLYFLQQFRNPAVDGIFRILNFFDTDYFICSLIAFIWVGFSWRWGIRLGFLMIASGWINTIAKMVFGLPRPFFLDPALAIVRVHDYGFPSGGAQTAILLAFLLIYYWKSRWAWPLGIFYMLLISFSRVFLGVHFPMDVLGGWILGALIFLVFIKNDRRIEDILSRHSAAACILTAAGAFAIAVLFQDYKTDFIMASFGVMAIGVYFSRKFDLYMTPPQEWVKKIALGLFGVGSAFVFSAPIRIFIADPFWALIIQAMASSLWISLLASPFCKKIFSIEPNTNPRK